MKTINALPFILLLFTAFAHAGERCDQVRALEIQMNANAPRKIDEYTELIQLKVNCDTKVISYSKRVLVPANVLPEGMYERKQRQHIQLHCNENGLASTTGWIAQDVIYDVNHQYLFTLKTTPDDCPK